MEMPLTWSLIRPPARGATAVAAARAAVAAAHAAVAAACAAANDQDPFLLPDKDKGQLPQLFRGHPRGHSRSTKLQGRVRYSYLSHEDREICPKID